MVDCRAEKMFGIESRSLKACHELLEVCCTHGLLLSIERLLALMPSCSVEKNCSCGNCLRIHAVCLRTHRSLPEVKQLLQSKRHDCRRASRTWCTWRAACRSGGMTASQWMGNSTRLVEGGRVAIILA